MRSPAAFAGASFAARSRPCPPGARPQKAAAGAAKGPKTLFENKARGVTGVGSGSGLEDLADIVQSSSGLSDPNLRKPPAPPPRRREKSHAPARNLRGGHSASC